VATAGRVAGTAALVAIGVAASIFIVTSDRVAIFDPILDTAIQTVILLGSIALAALSWVRYRTVGDQTALYQAGTFLLIATFSAVILGFRIADWGGALGMDLAHPGQTPLYLSTAIRLVSVGLLTVGAFDAWTRRVPRHPLLVALGPTIVLLIALPIVRELEPRLPELIPGLSYEVLTAGRSLLPQLAHAPFFMTVQAVTVMGFVVAAVLYERLYRRDGAIVRRYLAVALGVGAVAQVAFAVSPGTWHGLVTAEDAGSAVGYLLVLLGVEAQTRADARTLQDANLEIRLMRDTYVERAALDERSRLAREVHDGLAQELWFATLRIGRLAALPDLPAGARTLVSEIGASIETALSEARQAVLALSASSKEEPLYEVLSRYTEELGDRFGLLVDAEIDGPLPEFPARTQAEILRIVQEATNNTVKHADATAIRLVARLQGDELLVRVADNGRGFDARTTGGTSFGIRSMTQRAKALGGRLSIESADRDGTVVELFVPVP
jgi:signal transduction histidine kinase